MNEVLFFLEILICFTGVVVFEKLFSKYGMFSWVAIASILANLQTAKQVNLFGLSITLGGVLFASVYLATDILVEKYSFEDAKRAVYIGLCSNVVFIVSMLICCKWIPNSFDYVSQEFNVIFSFAPRICISSIVMFFISNLFDVKIFHAFKEKDGNKKLWKRNNISTIICNCAENFLFIIGAFLWIYGIKDCLIIAASTSVIEIIIALLDTPFLYFVVNK